MATRVKCGDCGNPFGDNVDQAASGTIGPCPKCGSTKRAIEMVVVDTVDVHDRLRYKGKARGRKKPKFEGETGDDLTIRTGRWADLTRHIDREGDRYFERVVDHESGEILHECDEPLSAHTGHGSATRPKQPGDAMLPKRPCPLRPMEPEGAHERRS